MRYPTLHELDRADIIEALERDTSHFARALGAALIRADRKNTDRIIDTFPDVITRALGPGWAEAARLRAEARQ